MQSYCCPGCLPFFFGFRSLCLQKNKYLGGLVKMVSDNCCISAVFHIPHFHLAHFAYGFVIAELFTVLVLFKPEIQPKIRLEIFFWGSFCHDAVSHIARSHCLRKPVTRDLWGYGFGHPNCFKSEKLFAFYPAPLKCLPSTHMYLFLHS